MGERRTIEDLLRMANERGEIGYAGRSGGKGWRLIEDAVRCGLISQVDVYATFGEVRRIYALTPAGRALADAGEGE